MTFDHTDLLMKKGLLYEENLKVKKEVHKSRQISGCTFQPELIKSSKSFVASEKSRQNDTSRNRSIERQRPQTVFDSLFTMSKNIGRGRDGRH